MKRNILEQIIRQVLNEASITIDIETLRPEDEQKMTTVHSLLKIKSKLDATPDRFSAADGFLIKIKRMGGRATDDTTGEKSFEISDSDIMQNAMLKLNTLSGQYSKMNSSEYVWLISHDVNLRKKDIEKAKASRIIATYIVQAFYIKRSLISKPLSTSTTGYIDTLSKGALVFDLQKIDENQWIRTSKIEPGDVTQTSEYGIPMKELQYKQKSASQVPVLFSYFAQNLYKILSPTETENLINSLKSESIYGDYHQAFVESFQQEQKLPVTGNWDADTLQRALQLEKPKYTFENTADLKSRLMVIIDAKKEQEQRISSIKVPTENFKFEVTTKNAEFYKVQLAMIEFCKNVGDVPNWPTDTPNKNVRNENFKKAKQDLSAIETALQDTAQQGTYGKKTQAVVQLCKMIIMQMLPDEKKVNLLNSTADVVDQQFVNAIITIKL